MAQLAGQLAAYARPGQILRKLLGVMPLFLMMHGPSEYPELQYHLLPTLLLKRCLAAVCRAEGRPPCRGILSATAGPDQHASPLLHRSRHCLLHCTPGPKSSFTCCWTSFWTTPLWHTAAAKLLVIASHRLAWLCCAAACAANKRNKNTACPCMLSPCMLCGACMRWECDVETYGGVYLNCLPCQPRLP